MHHFRLHAFDLATGREKGEIHSPTEIDAWYLGNGAGNVDGRIRFSPRKMLNRPGLLLLNGALYLAFTSHLDGEPKFEGHGRIMAFDAKSLRQLGALSQLPTVFRAASGKAGWGWPPIRGRERRFP